MRIRHVIIASCALAVLTACSDGPAEGQDLDWEDSPLHEALSAFYGYGGGQDPEELEREEQERMRETEDLVAACMAEEGFEYTPVVQTGATVYLEADDEWGTAEWAEQYGYGATTDPWAEEQPMEPEEEYIDPNQDYVEAMSATEQEAYYAALHGEPEIMEDDGEWVEEEEYVEYNWEDAGCYGSAQHEIYGDQEDAYQDPAFAEFFAAVEQVYEDVQRDPKVAEINAAWAECMADAGLTGMTTPEEAEMSFHDEMQRMYSAAEEQIDWESIDWETLEEGADPYQEAMDQAGLSELREREIATAVADHACREEHDVESRVLAIQFEHEEELIETYQAEIDALIATHGQSS